MLRRGKDAVLGRKDAIAAIAAILLFQTHADAQPNAPRKYPGPQCVQPEFEVLPEAEDPKATDKLKANLYDYEVRQYNREVEAYSSCIRKYMAKAKGDAQRIQDRANQEAKRITDEANASIAVIQAQMHKAEANAKKISGTPVSKLVNR